MDDASAVFHALVLWTFTDLGFLNGLGSAEYRIFLGLGLLLDLLLFSWRLRGLTLFIHLFGILVATATLHLVGLLLVFLFDLDYPHRIVTRFLLDLLFSLLFFLFLQHITHLCLKAFLQPLLNVLGGGFELLRGLLVLNFSVLDPEVLELLGCIRLHQVRCHLFTVFGHVLHSRRARLESAFWHL